MLAVAPAYLPSVPYQVEDLGVPRPFLLDLDSVLRIYAPGNDAELLLAGQIAGTMWQIERFSAIDTNAVAAQMDLTAGAIHQQFRNVDAITHMTLAFLDLGNGSRSLQNLDRHQARLRRQLTHYRSELLAMQNLGRSNQIAGESKLQNEPGS